MNWYDPNGIADYLDHLWYGLVLIAVAAVPAIINRRKLHAIKSETEEIKGSVINGHGDKPLREDVDRVIAEVGKMAAAVDRMSQIVTDIRADASDERATRRTEIRELREDVDARLTALNKRLH